MSSSSDNPFATSSITSSMTNFYNSSVTTGNSSNNVTVSGRGGGVVQQLTDRIPGSVLIPRGGGNSGLSSYSALSTLDRQYCTYNTTNTLGGILLFLQINKACCIPGGVEQLLKLQQQQSSSRITPTTSSHGNHPLFPPLEGSSNTPQSQQQQQQAAPQIVSLNEYDEGNDNYDDDGYYIGTGGKSSGGNKMGRLFKMATKVAGKTVTSIERQMQTLAVKADAGRNPDQVVAGIYWTNPVTQEELLLTATEPQSLFPQQQPAPEGSSTSNSDSMTVGLQFVIPLSIPTSILTTTEPFVSNPYVTIKLWIRSGATTSFLSKYYLLGSSSVPINIVQLQNRVTVQPQQQEQVPSRPHPVPLYFSIPVTSAYVPGGQFYITAIGDYKYPPLCQRGWSMSDPAAPTTVAMKTTATTTIPRLGNYQFYNLPLHQSYGFPFPSRPYSTLVAVERSIESTVIVPIAAAISKLAHLACVKSIQHANSVQQMLVSARHDAPAISGPYVDTVLTVSHLQCTDNTIDPLQSTATIIFYWQRPNSIFEVELLQTPIRIPLGQLPQHQLSLDMIRFFPKPLRHGILPAIFHAAGGKVPAATGFFLGSLRMQINVTLVNVGGSTGGATGSTSGSSLRFSTKNPFGGSMVPENPFDTLCLPAGSQQQPAQGQTGNDFGVYNTGVQQQQVPPAQQDVVWECILPLEQLFQQCQQTSSTTTKGYNVSNKAGQVVATLFMNVTMEMKQNVVTGEQPLHRIPADGGLVQLMGLDISLLLDGVLPALDFDDEPISGQGGAKAPPLSAEEQRRRNQLRTMGNFITPAYLEQHIKFVRKMDCDFFHTRATEYLMTISNAVVAGSATSAATSAGAPIEAHMDRSPKPFRPSSSRPEMLLSGIPFNVHTATLALDVLDPTTASSPQPSTEHPGAVFVNVTCGAPSDHARGFGNVFATKRDANTPTQTVGLQSPVGPAVGGLRRLEAKRAELATEVSNLQTMLIMSIGNFFMEQRQQASSSVAATASPGQAPNAIHHVPARNMELQSLRWKVFEAVQCLHHLTWTCAVRRASVFSQALGIAVTTYLASISCDPHRTLQTNWPEVWVKHGFLLCYEGLLSAVGKELGMMEDASTGINMLQMVQVILVPDDGQRPSPTDAVPVPFSPYLRWIALSKSSTTNTTSRTSDFILQIGIVQSYYNERIPTVLKNGAAVRFYPLLFEVGVDIRQWGANTGSNMMKRGMNSASGSSTNQLGSEDGIATGDANGGGDDDVDEDTVGTSDTDVLVQLNYEAFQKMNEYAYTVAPPATMPVVPPSQPGIKHNLPPHQYLAVLYQHIVSSAGKMNHDILDHAATLAQQLGGGGAVFCKSGKDRTAMHVTYKQAQFMNQFRKKQTPPNATAPVVVDTTLADANLLRTYGTRLPVCEKNVGQAKFAFNSLQVKFMPDALKPPASTLAGFLKGGKVFGGGIES